MRLGSAFHGHTVVTTTIILSLVTTRITLLHVQPVIVNGNSFYFFSIVYINGQILWTSKNKNRISKYKPNWIENVRLPTYSRPFWAYRKTGREACRLYDGVMYARQIPWSPVASNQYPQ